MAKITLKGNPVNTSGNLPATGSKAPDFTLVKSDLSSATLLLCESSTSWLLAGKTQLYWQFQRIFRLLPASSVLQRELIM
jgi:hypothetical protein